MRYTIIYHWMTGNRITNTRTFDSEQEFIECVTLDRKDGYCFWTESRTENELIVSAI